MRKLFIRLAAVVSFTILLIGCGPNDSYTNAVSNQSFAVVEFNAYNVLQKSGMYNDLMVTAKDALRSEGAPDYAISLVEDLFNTGIDIHASMYGYAYMLDKNNIFMGLVGKTYSVEKLNALIAFIEGQANETLSKVQLDGYTLIDLDRNVALGYNENAIVLGVIERLNYYGDRAHVDVKECISEALKNTVDGEKCDKLPSFAGSDIACRMDMSPIVDFLKSASSGSYDPDIATAISMLEKVRDAKLNFAGNFATGSVDLELEWSGLPESTHKALSCSNKNLQYVSDDAWFVANLPFHGESVVAVINNLLDDQMIRRIIDDIAQEVTGNLFTAKSAMAFASPLISSINGDITIALNKLSNFDNYKPNIDALAVVTVKNESIINLASGAIASIPGAHSLGDNIYQIFDDGIIGYIGQKEDLIFASTPTIIEQKKQSATKAKWYSEVKGSYGYVVLNLASLFASPEVRRIPEELGYSRNDAFYINSINDLLDYTILSIPTTQSASYRIVFKNDNENALKQVVDVLKPLITIGMMDLY